MSKFIPLQNISFNVLPSSQKYSFKKIAAEYYGKPKAQNYAVPFMVHDEVYVDIDIRLAEMQKSMGGILLSNASPKFGEFYKNPLMLEQLVEETKKITEQAYQKGYASFSKFRADLPPTPPKPSSPSITRLYEVACSLSRSYGIETACFACSLPMELRYFEVFTHEVIHSYLLSPDPHPTSTSRMGDILRDMPGWLANEHELTTLRCEAAALAAYGGGVDTVWIWERANWRPPGSFRRWSYGNPKEYAPDKAKLLAPLTVAENTVVQRFHALIKEHLK